MATSMFLNEKDQLDQLKPAQEPFLFCVTPTLSCRHVGTIFCTRYYLQTPTSGAR